MSESVYEEIKNAITSYDVEGTFDAAKKALNLGIAPNDIIDNAISKALQEVGKKYEVGELWLPQIVAAAECAQKTLNELLAPEIKKRNEKISSKGKILIGTVEGDVHDIGKSIVAAMLIADGFEVVDIGRDISCDKFIEKIKELKPDILGTSAMLTNTRPRQKEIALALEKEGLSGKVKHIIGGVAGDAAWGEECGAVFSFNCVEAVKDANKLMSQ